MSEWELRLRVSPANAIIPYMPKCSKCCAVKPASLFYNSGRAGGSGLSRWCAECHRVYQRAHRAGAEDREQLRKAQGNRCAICSQHETSMHVVNGIRQRRQLSLDIARNGAIRGLLCSRCNTGLGLFNDDPIRLRRAVEYVLHMGVI